MSVDFATYRQYLKRSICAEKRLEEMDAEDAIGDLEDTENYQDDAERNGQSQPLITQRKDSNKCKVIVPRGGKLYIGDWVYVLGENWLCMKLYTDEYGVTYGELWMCNHLFKYQDFSNSVIERWGIIDDGSYSNATDKSINVTDNTFKCYISRDEQTNCLYVDKRIAIDVLYDKSGKAILEVGKITVIDTKTGNYGDGSHLLTFKMKHDVYAPEVDSIEELLCDYNMPAEVDQEEDSHDTPRAEIIGNRLLTIGATRTYTLKIENHDVPEDIASGLIWSLDGNRAIVLTPKGDKCAVEVPLEVDLIGSLFTLICEDNKGEIKRTTFEVEVIPIG